MEDIETILNTLIYDGKVEMTIIAAKEGTVGSVDGQMKLYRAVSPLIQPTGLVRTPCGLCPVSNKFCTRIGGACTFWVQPFKWSAGVNEGFACEWFLWVSKPSMLVILMSITGDALAVV